MEVICNVSWGGGGGGGDFSSAEFDIIFYPPYICSQSTAGGIALVSV